MEKEGGDLHRFFETLENLKVPNPNA